MLTQKDRRKKVGAGVQTGPNYHKRADLTRSETDSLNVDSYVLRQNPFAQVVVPDHKELDKGTLRVIIRYAGLTVENFIKLI